MRKQIICIGNRLLPSDNCGSKVYDRLVHLQLDSGIDIVEGGLAGLNLLPLLEKGGRVVFVDNIRGFNPTRNFIVMDAARLLQETEIQPYGHNSGLPYLLRVLPNVVEGTVPEEIIIVGIEGECDSDTIEEIAMLTSAIARYGISNIQGFDYWSIDGVENSYAGKIAEGK